MSGDPWPYVTILSLSLGKSQDEIITSLEVALKSGCKPPTLDDLHRARRDVEIYRKSAKVAARIIAGNFGITRQHVHRIIKAQRKRENMLRKAG